MPTLSSIVATCPQDLSVAANASLVLTNLADALESFADKQPAEAIKDLHEPLLDWEEVLTACAPDSGCDLTVTVVTDGVTWVIDLGESDWILDLKASIFHGRLIFKANVLDDEHVD